MESSPSDDECDQESQPRVPLTVDPEFVDPNQGKYKYGIVYLSYVPEGLTVKILKEIMSEFGEVGRIYLEPEKSNKKHRSYTEGWIEFKKKRVAKSVAKSLNGKPIQYGRKRCKMNGQIWSLKYLHKFKWAHLTEQLALDRATKQQRRRFELSQTKKQVDFYQSMTERSRRQKKQAMNDKDEVTDKNTIKRIQALQSKQKQPKSAGNELQVPVDEDFLSCIFKKVE